MNCKPGDLAVIVKPGISSRNLGKLVVCVEIAFDTLWFVESLSPCHKENGRLESWGLIEDERLRPIRPGDISDEEVRDLYLPKVPEAA